MKKFIIAAVILLLSPVFTPSIANAQNMSEVDKRKISQNEKVEIIEKNSIYQEFEKEFEKLEEIDELAEEDVLSLIEKYDGAEFTVLNETSDISTFSAASRSSRRFSVKFVRGGINLFATNRSGMQSIQSVLGKTGSDLTVFAFLIGLPLSPIAGFFAGVAVESLPFSEGANVMYNMLRRGRTYGGVRLTLTRAKAIYSINGT